MKVTLAIYNFFLNLDLTEPQREKLLEAINSQLDLISCP